MEKVYSSVEVGPLDGFVVLNLQKESIKNYSLSTHISIFTLLYIQLLATFMKTFEYAGDES
jgi:hypothetical protein